MNPKGLKSIRKKLEKKAKKPIQKKNWKVVKRLFRKKGNGIYSNILKCSSDKGEIVARLVKACKSTSLIHVIQEGEVSYAQEIDENREAILLIAGNLKNIGNNDSYWEIYLYQP